MEKKKILFNLLISVILVYFIYYSINYFIIIPRKRSYCNTESIDNAIEYYKKTNAFPKEGVFEIPTYENYFKQCLRSKGIKD